MNWFLYDNGLRQERVKWVNDKVNTHKIAEKVTFIQKRFLFAIYLITYRSSHRRCL